MGSELEANPELDAGARAALDLVVSMNVAGVAEALATLEVPSEVYAVALLFDDATDDLEVLEVLVGLEHDRREALHRRTPIEAFMHVWNAELFSGGAREVRPRLSERARFREGASTLLVALRSHGIADPSRWVAARVAREVTRAPQPFATTPDFVAFVPDSQFADDLLAVLRISATVEARRSLEQKRLLPATADDLLQQHDDVAEDATAYVTERMDDDMEDFLARFDCVVTGVADTWGPQDAPLDDALDWARTRTRRVVLKVGDDEFSAGAERLPHVPEWVPRPVRPRPAC